MYNVPSPVSSHRTPKGIGLPTYQYRLPSTMTANTTLPAASIRLFLGEPPKKDLAVAGSDTGLEVHFSSSVGIDIGLVLDLAEFITVYLLFGDLELR